ncbi:MAG: DNA repair protein RecO [Cyclobacteriaceae bacterium]
MLKKTEGIVFNYIKYRETSIITKIFTRELGYKTYLVNGVRSAKSKTKMAHFQPLTLLDLVVYEKENANINRISEAKLAKAFHHIPFDFFRSGISMLMVEVLGKVIYENYLNQQLFDYLSKIIVYLDSETCEPANFILVFLIGTSSFLGFEPENAENFYLQLPHGQPGEHIRKKVKYLDVLIESPLPYQEKIPPAIRRALVDDWLLFYKIHMESFGEIKSLQVLRNLI